MRGNPNQKLSAHAPSPLIVAAPVPPSCPSLPLSVPFSRPRNLGDQELGQRLAVARLAAVVLLGVHLEDDLLGALGLVIQDGRLHRHARQVWPAHGEGAVSLERQDAAQGDGRARVGLCGVEEEVEEGSGG